MTSFLGSWWNLIPLLVLGAFLFSAVFRYRLNKLRGKHWCYIAPWSNVYDRVILRVSETLKGQWRTRYEKVLLAKKFYHNDHEIFHPISVRCIHRAGRLAYITEAFIALASAGVIIYFKL